MTRAFGHGAFYVTAASLLFVASGYVINVWLGRLLGPREYGVFGVVVGVLTIITGLQNAGVPQAVGKYVAEDEERRESILRSGLSVQIASSAALTVLLLLAAPALAVLLRDPGLTPYLVAGALVLLPHGVFTLYVGYYNGRHAYTRQTLMMATHAVAKAAATIGLAYPFHIFGAIVGYLVGPVAGWIVAPHRPRASAARFPWRTLVTFSIPLIAFFVLISLQLVVDLFIVKAAVAEPAAAGYYTAAQNIARMPYYALSGLGLILAPAIARTTSAGADRDGDRIVYQALRLGVLLVVPAAGLIAATSGPLVQLLYSDEYAPASGPLAVLAAGVACMSIFTLLAAVLVGAGKPTAAVRHAAAGLVTTVVSCAVLVPMQGLVGAATGTALGAIVSLVWASFEVRRLYPRFIARGSVIRIAAATLVVCVATRALSPSGISLVAVGPAAVCIYVLILMVIGEVGQEDRESLRSLLPSRAGFPGASD